MGVAADGMSLSRRALGRMASLLRGHPRVSAAAASSIAAGVAAVVAKRRSSPLPALPDAMQLASATASAVHNAAKASVLAAVREHDDPSRSVALDAVRQAVTEAASSGADVVPAALGAVEGAIEIAEPLGDDPREVARVAAEAAQFAAGVVGSVASRRVGEALAPVLRQD